MLQVQEIDEQYLRGILIKGIFLVNFGLSKVFSSVYNWKYFYFFLH